MIPDADLPYAGLRVLDISQGIAGPYCAHVLWQQGAHVLKVEPPAGDWIRFVGVTKGDHNALAIQYNAGKQALALDARTDAGKKILRGLASQADVIVQNFRPGVAERLGVGYKDLSLEKPDLVYVSISGYGPDGPYADAPATDSVMQADSGLMFSNQDESGMPRRVGLLAADVMTGLYASQGAATALYQRAKVADKLPPVANVVISNVPGPPIPLYMAGAKMLTNYPCSIVVHGVALNITVQSYNGNMDFGIIACRESAPVVTNLDHQHLRALGRTDLHLSGLRVPLDIAQRLDQRIAKCARRLRGQKKLSL